MAFIDFDPHCVKWSPLKKFHADTAGSSTLDKWRHNNASLLQNGTEQCQNTDRLVNDGYRLVKDRTEANNLSERDVRQNLEHRVDAIGYCEDELEGALYDVRMEDDRMQYCYDRLRDCIKTNVNPIWELAKRCLDLRTKKPPTEAVEDDVNYLLREEMKQSERTAKILDDVISRVEEQHRRNNAITYRCKHLKNLDYETREAVKFCHDFAKQDGEHQKEDLLVQLNPVKMNFAEWSALVQNATRTGMREISASHKLRLEGDDHIKKSDEAIERLYRETDEALKRRIIAQKLAKEKLVDEHNKQVNEVIDHLTNLYKIAIKPERTAQHELAKKVLKTYAKKSNDPVENALYAEVYEFKDTHCQLDAELDKCAKQMVTLRSVDIQLMDDVHRKEEALHVDEVQVLELRNLAKLRQV
ncbi:hypothetical protein BV898_12920 [Hypsibius exemplaris]|uniref:Tektin n=1 Tax=Hypsibius exemplaris TaxID=2072580 RepID=A0A1W0WC57_HYPEX|nr:hypothetical protein BV898_12920 [Hypsibius exemplaris]